ncbi:hypothetical protein ACWDG1_45280 [Streptomyces sp. NPDC001177]
MLVPLSLVSPAAQANPVKPAVLKPDALDGKTKGHIVKWCAPHVPFANIPLRCGNATGFGFGFGFNPREALDPYGGIITAYHEKLPAGARRC